MKQNDMFKWTNQFRLVEPQFNSFQVEGKNDFFIKLTWSIS